MLILKGEHGKSAVVNTLMEYTESECFMYCEHPINSIKGYHLDSEVVMMTELKRHINNFIKYEIGDKQLDYFIVYTNITLGALKLYNIDSYLENVNINSNCIILTCK